jgi:hypothetical protein
MSNKVSAAFSEMRLLQCTPEAREIILPFVEQIYIEINIENSVIRGPLSSQTKAEQFIPNLYRNTGIATMFFCILGFIFMFIDAIFSVFGLSFSVYIIWCLCCLSLFFTNKIALAEWKSINERQREAFQEDHNT